MPTYKVNFMLCGHPEMLKWERCDDVQTALKCSIFLSTILVSLKVSLISV